MIDTTYSGGHNTYNPDLGGKLGVLFPTVVGIGTFIVGIVVGNIL